MTCAIIIESNSNIRQYTFVPKGPNYDEDFYKRAGFKVAEGFKCHHTWKIGNTGNTIYVYGKTSGRANQENKYEFPPPIDNTLFFGSCFLIMKNSEDEFVDLMKADWQKIYEQLYGGFEDLVASGDTLADAEAADIAEEEAAEEEDEYADLEKTETGYAKDGFVVEDGDDADDEEEYVPDEEEKPVAKKEKKVKYPPRKYEINYIDGKNVKTYLEPRKPPKKKVKSEEEKNAEEKQKAEQKQKKVARAQRNKKAVVERDPERNCYLECESELSEEEYL